jgi:2-(1,2-epoxy-1,2-dihydrophenyl)acetyl-CoA isomerase
MPVHARRDGAVLTITMDRPEQLNAFDREQHRALADALAQARAGAVRAVVITGAGRGFSVGQDLGEVRAEAAAGHGGNDTRLRDGYHPNIRAIRALGKPVIAAVNGVAAGAGLSLAVACDIRIASERASFVPAFVNLGLVPDSGASFFVPRLVGCARAFEWLASGRHLDAARALDWGLVNEVTLHEEVVPRAREAAELLASHPGEGVAATKRLLDRSLELTLEEELDRELEAQLRALGSPEYQAAMAAFLDRSAR